MGGRSTANWSVIASSRRRNRKSAAGRPPLRPGSRRPPVASSTSRRSSTRWRFVAESSCPERGGVEVAQLRDRERLGCEREADVRVRELRPQPLAPGEDDLAVVERGRRQRLDRVPRGVAGEPRVGVGGDEPQVRRRELPLARHPAGVAARVELLEVGELADVHLLGELALDRLLERLAGGEVAARERPRAGIGARAPAPTAAPRARARARAGRPPGRRGRGPGR